ncbi:MAG: hypothetical protein ACFE94_03335 [Candidatus Hodarchaeota archaeon]
MSFFKFYTIGKKHRQKKQYIKILICIFFALLFTLNFFDHLSLNQVNGPIKDFNSENKDLFNFDKSDLDITTDLSMLENPFTENFDLLRIFFDTKYKSSLDLDIFLYYREGDTNGIITDDTIYSEDNLLMYNSLMKTELDSTEIFNTYLKLKSTPLWYEDDNGQFNYGFVRSVDNSTGEVKDDNRYLIDNVLPIFLLIETIGEDIDDISINGEFPKDSIEEMFSLINSTNFWDETYDGFFNSNSTSNKYSESNFYSILANLLIHRTYHQQNIGNNIKDRAYELADKTMDAIINNMWDSTGKAFYYNADIDWDTSTAGQKYYHLDVNALGIIALLEYWVGSGMESDSPFFIKAVNLYNSLDSNLWNSIDKLYHKVAQPNWNIINFDYDLAANALMLEACIRLFQLTGNITYYDRAIEIFNSFENNLFDSTNNAYNYALADTSKNFNSNLKLFDAYLRASNTFSSTILDANYNLTATVPNFVFNQDIMNLTSYFAFENIEYYYNLSIDSYVPFTTKHNITDADINYIFKYPNGTFLDQFNHQIISPDESHTLIYDIEETLPIGEGYYIYIWANKTYFNLADTIKRFNVNSGLINETIEGLVSFLYQGPLLNITLPINYTRKDNLTLTASLEGNDIINFTAQEINFTASTELDELTYIEFNLTARLGAIPGPSVIVFKITQGNILYLEIKKIIEIGYSFDYENLLYQSRVVSGENIEIFMNLINYLPNATQLLNVSFTGKTKNSIEPYIQEETLDEKEIRTVSYNLKTLENIENDIIRIEMAIKQNTTTYYTEELTIEIIPRFEIISVSFPKTVTQGAAAYFIAVLKNNLDHPEGISLFFNGELVQSNIEELIPGENRIEKKIIPATNPYEFGTKTYRVILKDSENNEIARFFFEITLELSTFNLIIFYVVPVIIPIGIILYFLHKQLKYKKLRR